MITDIDRWTQENRKQFCVEFMWSSYSYETFQELRQDVRISIAETTYIHK